VIAVNNTLLDLNANPDLDLLVSHNVCFSADDNINPYDNLNINSCYYNIPSFSTTFQKSKSTTFFNINIQSLTSKIYNLSPPLYPKTSPFPSLLCKKSGKFPSLRQFLSLDKFVHKQRSNGRGGGVGFYLLQSIPHKILQDFSPFAEKSFESLSIEITLNWKKIILTNIYRPPIPTPGLSPSEFITNFY
jgi:hypothetical protein